LLTNALESREPGLPRITELNSDTTLDQAYAAQKRLVDVAFREEKVIGYKGAASTAGAMQRFGIDEPMHCAIFDSATPPEAAGSPVESDEHMVIETEIGYIMGVDIPTRIEDASEAQTATQAVLAAIELPTSLNMRMGEKLTAADFIASNCGGRTRIFTGEKHHPDKVDWAQVPVKLSRDGETLIDSNAAATKGGQWENLKTLINQIVDQGRVIHEGDIILSGAIGGPQPASRGKYSADYGQLGKVELSVQ
jgi:2-keto-4-pentenoate hydratase